MMEGDSGAYVPPEGGNSVWLVGDRITVKLSSEDTGGAYCVAEEISPPQGGRLRTRTAKRMRCFTC